jgi:hypothetical protein
MPRAFRSQGWRVFPGGPKGKGQNIIISIDKIYISDLKNIVPLSPFFFHPTCDLPATYLNRSPWHKSVVTCLYHIQKSILVG